MDWHGADLLAEREMDESEPTRQLCICHIQILVGQDIRSISVSLSWVNDFVLISTHKKE